jgi:hypothetical protein
VLGSFPALIDIPPGVSIVKHLRIVATLALAFACLPAGAETLVQQCDQLSATDCARAVWVRPPAAITVRVLRGATSPWVQLSDVLPTERIYVCVDDPSVAVGATANCATLVPGRTDRWQLKSLVYPAIPASPAGTKPIVVQWEPVTTYSDGTPAPIAGYIVSMQQDVCSPDFSDPRCGTMPWTETDVGAVNSHAFPLTGRWCFGVQARLATGERGVISDQNPAQTCAAAGAVVRLPAKVTGVKASS